MTEHERPLELVGVGLGPFNLAVAALADPIAELSTAFYDARERFAWHPGLLLDDATLQVPFLADLVTLADPTSRWSFLNYLAEHDRMFPFYFAERFHMPRREYDAYCRWVAESLPACHFGSRVESVAWRPDASRPPAGHFEVTVADAFGRHRVRAHDVVLGLGTVPEIPAPLSALPGDGVVSSSAFLTRRDALLRAGHVTVVGSGQSGAEIVLDLLRAEDGPAVTWVTRTPAFAPMEYSKLGLEHFTPDYTRYFAGLPEATRRRLVPEQWQLYKAASADTLAEVFDALYDRTLDGETAQADLLPGTELTGARRVGPNEIELAVRHGETGAAGSIRTNAVVAATGYRPVAPTVLDPMADLVDWNEGSYRLDENCRVALDASVGGSLYVLNAALHEHGVGTPDLGLGAHRAARIVNDVVTRQGLRSGGSTAAPYRLPSRTAFTSFGFDDGARLGLTADSRRSLGGAA